MPEDIKYTSTNAGLVEQLKPVHQTTMVLSLYDLKSQEHGPLFQSVSLDLAWRSVDKLLGTGDIPREDVYLVVHGLCHHGLLTNSLEAFPKAVLYSCVSKTEVTYDV